MPANFRLPHELPSGDQHMLRRSLRLAPTGAYFTAKRIELTLISAALAYFALSPALVHLPICPFAYFAGVACPTCGTTRSAWSIMHGNLAAAWSLNPIGFLVIAVLFRRAWWLARPQSLLARLTCCKWADAALAASFLLLALLRFFGCV